MKERYAIIKADEDGNPLYFIEENKIRDILDDPEGEMGIDNFGEDWPKEDNPQYWEDGFGLLVKIQIIPLKKKTVAWRME